MKTPLVFDIARGSFVDGPGIRTVVFLKGCPLRCFWCQNPESQSSNIETSYYPEYCIHCGNCNKGCDSLARRIIGKYYPPDELSEIIMRDEVFYETSEGGVTFSGGEPLMFVDYLWEVSHIIKKKDVHIAIETCGYFDFEIFEERLLPFIDLILYDIKIMDPVKHKKFTGKSNESIIRNFKELQEKNVTVIPRIPLIPDYTATEENLSQIAEFFRQLDICDYQFLTYNPSWIEKRKRLGKIVHKKITRKPMILREEMKWADFFSTAIK